MDLNSLINDRPSSLRLVTVAFAVVLVCVSTKLYQTLLPLRYFN